MYARATVEHNRRQSVLEGRFVHTIHTSAPVITEHDAQIVCVHAVQLGHIFRLGMVKGL